MNTPRIVSLREQLVHPAVSGLGAVRAWAGPEASLFVVVEGGVFAGRRWHEGDVVVCTGVPHDGALVVLEARGLGRPRLGSVQGRALHGDVGEACRAARWAVAGEVAWVVRPASGRQSCGSGSAEGSADPRLPGWRVIEATAEGAVASVARTTPLRLVPPAHPVAPPAPARRPAAGQLALFGRAAA